MASVFAWIADKFWWYEGHGEVKGAISAMVRIRCLKAQRGQIPFDNMQTLTYYAVM
jgi:hypothetical protein